MALFVQTFNLISFQCTLFKLINDQEVGGVVQCLYPSLRHNYGKNTNIQASKIRVYYELNVNVLTFDQNTCCGYTKQCLTEVVLLSIQIQVKTE